MCVVVVGEETYDVVFVKVYMWLTKKTKKNPRFSFFVPENESGGGGPAEPGGLLSHTQT
jgi:hypothetical protein